MTANVVVKENEKNGTVTVNGSLIVGGFIDDDFFCDHCGSVRVYYDKHDAYFCPSCNIWLEGRCSDPDCNYCSGRPRTPLPNKDNEREPSEPFENRAKRPWWHFW